MYCGSRCMTEIEGMKWGQETLWPCKQAMRSAALIHDYYINHLRTLVCCLISPIWVIYCLAPIQRFGSGAQGAQRSAPMHVFTQCEHALVRPGAYDQDLSVKTTDIDWYNGISVIF